MIQLHMGIRKFEHSVVNSETENVNEKFKESIFTELSHEIRTPLNSIMGFTQLLDKDNLTEEQKRRYYKYIIDSSNDLLNYADKILNKYKNEI